MKNVPTLKLSKIQEAVYLVFVAVIPTIIAACEIFVSHSSIFKFTISSVGILLLAVIMIKKYVLNSKIKVLKEKIILLEHDYSISVGDAESIRTQWGKYNMIIYATNASLVVFALLLSVVFINGMVEGLIKFRGAAVIIFISVVIGMICKIIMYKGVRKNETQSVDDAVSGN